MSLQEKPYYYYLLSLFSGVLLWLGWPTIPAPFVLFFAFIPLLWIEKSLSLTPLKRKGWKFLGYAYITLLLWNILTTHWIYNATAGGGIFAITANAALMCIPLMVFYVTRKYTNDLIGYSSFIVYWICFEYWHLNWDLSWPWLTLGNGFASVPVLVQWYEYTGALGGTLWVLMLNVLLFWGISEKKNWKYYLIPFFLIIIPIMLSLYVYANYNEQGKDVEVVVVQPNIDPYTEKFIGTPNFIPYEDQVERFIKLSMTKVTDSTAYLVWPETALPSGYMENNLEGYTMIQDLRTFVNKYPRLSLITGFDSYKFYQTKATPSSRYVESHGGYLDAFNAAMQMRKEKEIVIYRKSKLVPGVEHMPPALSSLAIALGESAHGLGKQNERTVFFNQDSIGVAPVICYESIFGEFVGKYINNGANLIFIITNDGWWGNTQGHKQHLEFATLRAVESRKSIARSANTGISGFIDQRGRILQRSEYWKQDVMKMKLKENSVKTFYIIHGDYIGKLALYLTFVLLAAALLYKVRKRRYNPIEEKEYVG